MKKRALFLVVVAIGCFLAVGCDGRKNRESAQSEAAEQAAAVAVVEEIKEPVREGTEYECEAGNAGCRDFVEFLRFSDYATLRDYENQDHEDFYFSGTVFNTFINTGVNVRGTPSRNGEILFTAKEDTEVQVLGISRDGWAFVSVKEEMPRRGWIFGSFIDFKGGLNLSELKPVEMRIIDFNITAEDSSTADLTAVYEINDVQRTMTLSAFRAEGQNFFTFFYDTYVAGSHYAIMPGLYTWNFARNQLRHMMFLTREPYISYNFDLLLWNIVRFTDDKRFFIVGDNKEYGDKIALRTSDNKTLFVWGYAGGCIHHFSFDFKANTITVACPADSVVAENFADIEEMDNTVSKYMEEFAINNPSPKFYLRTVEVLCEVSLETGARRITGARWMYCE